MSLCRYSLAACIGLLLSSVSAADIINIQSDSGNSTSSLGSYVGSLDYSFLGGNSGSLTVTLTNTTPVADGGFLTGFLFNVGSNDPFASADFLGGDYPFLEAAGESGNPFGSSYVGGAALGGNFEGGGNPTVGIDNGDTGIFSFAITASDASSLSAASFLEGPYEFNFIVRFRGFANGGSDKVPGTTVPGPGALALLGLAGLASRRRSR